MAKGSDPRHDRAVISATVFALALFAFLFVDWPLKGMVISDAWRWYMPSSQFDWPLGTEQVWRQDPYVPSWASLVTRRSLGPFWLELVTFIAVGDKRVFLNLLCIVIQLLNVALFAHIVWRLAGTRRLYPILLVALLYPYAAQSRFWQDMVKLNLAATFFLASLALFLHLLDGRPSLGRKLALSAGSLVCFWISIMTQEFAIFMSPLYLYLALFYDHERRTLFRFRPRWSFSCGLAACFLGLTVVASLLLTPDSPTYLLYFARFREVASHTGVPPGLVAFAVIVGNVILCAISALFFNSAGIVLQPLHAIWMDRAVLVESGGWAASIVILGAAAVALWRFAWADPKGPADRAQERTRGDLLVVVGGLWSALAYLPFFTALGYPRIAGLMVDRENILAMWGVSMCLGELGHRLYAARAEARKSLAPFYGALFLVATVLVGNMYVQKQYYIETARKERELALLILDARVAHPSDGRTPIVLLDKKEKTTWPRAQLLGALDQPGLLHRGLSAVKLLANRYFLQVSIIDSFHLNGIPLFGCCPGAAAQTFFGYAQLESVPFVPVYTIDGEFRLEQDAETYRLGYLDQAVWSKSQGEVSWSILPKRQYMVRVLELGDSYFRLRGPLAYSLRDYEPISRPP